MNAIIGPVSVAIAVVLGYALGWYHARRAVREALDELERDEALRCIAREVTEEVFGPGAWRDPRRR